MVDSAKGGRADALTLKHATQQGVFKRMPESLFDSQTQLSVFACNASARASPAILMCIILASP